MPSRAVLALLLSSFLLAAGFRQEPHVPAQPTAPVEPEASTETPQTEPVPPTEGLSPRNASYRIEVALDPETKILTGKETITWRNIQPIAADELKLHLYWNAWRNNRSTWLEEARLRQGGRNLADPEEGDYAYSDVRSVELVPDVGMPGIDLTSGARFEAPDDGNPDDRTVMVVALPEPVEPEQVAQIELEWTAKVPRTFARTGFRGDFFFIAQWFPKLAVLEADGLERSPVPRGNRVLLRLRDATT